MPNQITRISNAELHRFRIEGKIGEGADSEVFAAADAASGLPVVLKRPHPMLIARAQHDAVERRMARAIALREQAAGALPHVAKMLAYTDRAAHHAYFGDALTEPYTVVVEERAAGVPLVASAIDGIKRHPIGAPQNLFAAHPLVPHHRRGRFAIISDLLEVAEAFQAAGALILDMRPQNIYLAPQNAAITVIDIGGAAAERPAIGGRPPLDMHDFYLELFKWYIPTSPPHTDAAAYAKPIGMETVPRFAQDIDGMLRRISEHADDACNLMALDMLHKVKARAYPDIPAFKRDLDGYLRALDAGYALLAQCEPQCEPVMRAWTDALDLLTADYWRKYLFDPASLAAYRR